MGLSSASWCTEPSRPSADVNVRRRGRDVAVAVDTEDAEAEEAVGEIRLVIQSTRASIITVAGFTST